MPSESAGRRYLVDNLDGKSGAAIWFPLWPISGWLIGLVPCVKIGCIGCWIIDAPIVGPISVLWWLS